MAQLVELRVNLQGYINAAEFFAIMTNAEQLLVLEVIGFFPYDSTSDPTNMLPPAGFARLRELYLGIMLPLFGVRSLRSLASKTPHLHKLALIVESPNGVRWANKELQDLCETILYQFHLSTVNKTFSEWRLVDLGILYREWNPPSVVRVRAFEGVLKAISRKVPSVKSFYGTGNVCLKEGIENDIDKKWGGELWNSWDW
ncbi:hypothetical protein DL96DRAFT_1641404 [Flagelloscypha sp. PMI_526]|nr:hypothetical protein DL96DRAFT_1641404 [Flagelloscypha sp. PMI_526]